MPEIASTLLLKHRKFMCIIIIPFLMDFRCFAPNIIIYILPGHIWHKKGTDLNVLLCPHCEFNLYENLQFQYCISWSLAFCHVMCNSLLQVTLSQLAQLFIFQMNREQ